MESIANKLARVLLQNVVLLPTVQILNIVSKNLIAFVISIGWYTYLGYIIYLPALINLIL